MSGKALRMVISGQPDAVGEQVSDTTYGAWDDLGRSLVQHRPQRRLDWQLHQVLDSTSDSTALWPEPPAADRI